MSEKEFREHDIDAFAILGRAMAHLSAWVEGLEPNLEMIASVLADYEVWKRQGQALIDRPINE